LPLGFGLGGRLLLERRGRVYVKSVIIKKLNSDGGGLRSSFIAVSEGRGVSFVGLTF